MNVAIRISDGYLTNDLVSPPKLLLFQLIPAINPFEEETDAYFLRLNSMVGSPYLGYDVKNQKFCMKSTPIICSSNQLWNQQEIYSSEEVVFETQEQILGTWHLYLGDNWQEYESPPRKSNKYLVWIWVGFFLLFIIFILMIYWQNSR